MYFFGYPCILLFSLLVLLADVSASVALVQESDPLDAIKIKVDLITASCPVFPPLPKLSNHQKLDLQTMVDHLLQLTERLKYSVDKLTELNFKDQLVDLLVEIENEVITTGMSLQNVTSDLYGELFYGYENHNLAFQYMKAVQVNLDSLSNKITDVSECKEADRSNFMEMLTRLATMLRNMPDNRERAETATNIICTLEKASLGLSMSDQAGHFLYVHELIKSMTHCDASTKDCQSQEAIMEEGKEIQDGTVNTEIKGDDHMNTNIDIQVEDEEALELSDAVISAFLNPNILITRGPVCGYHDKRAMLLERAITSQITIYNKLEKSDRLARSWSYYEWLLRRLEDLLDSCNLLTHQLAIQSQEKTIILVVSEIFTVRGTISSMEPEFMSISDEPLRGSVEELETIVMMKIAELDAVCKVGDKEIASRCLLKFSALYDRITDLSSKMDEDDLKETLLILRRLMMVAIKQFWRHAHVKVVSRILENVYLGSHQHEQPLCEAFCGLNSMSFSRIKQLLYRFSGLNLLFHYCADVQNDLKDLMKATVDKMETFTFGNADPAVVSIFSEMFTIHRNNSGIVKKHKIIADCQSKCERLLSDFTTAHEEFNKLVESDQNWRVEPYMAAMIQFCIHSSDLRHRTDDRGILVLLHVHEEQAYGEISKFKHLADMKTVARILCDQEYDYTSDDSRPVSDLEYFVFVARKYQTVVFILDDAFDEHVEKTFKDEQRRLIKEMENVWNGLGNVAKSTEAQSFVADIKGLHSDSSASLRQSTRSSVTQ